MTTPILRSIKGMNNRLDPTRLPFDSDALSGFAAEIVNMRVRRSGEVARDVGSSLIIEGGYHSMFCDDSCCYVGKDNAIYRFLEDGTTREVVTGLSGSRFTFVKLGSLVFYSDTVSNRGILKGDVSYGWKKQKYLADSSRVFSGAPVPKKMAVLNGRMYMVPANQPDTIVWSERGQVGLYNLAESHRRLESEIIMIAAVKSGLFVSTTERTVFLRITSPHNIALEPIDNKPAVEWSLAHRRENCSKLGLELPGQCRLWRGHTGACVGTDDGLFFNITENDILLPETCNSSGASIVVGDYYYHVAQ